MMKFVQLASRAAVVAAAALALSACSSLSKVKADGSTDEPVWPKWDSVSFNNKRGTFPDLGSLSQVKPGLTKDELYYLLGRPHYNEVWRPREWNYLFHFHTPGQGTNGVTTCQFKVLFDKNRFSGSTYWKAVDPADATCPPQPQAAAAMQQHYTLSADVLFAFDRSSERDLQPRGREELSELAAKLRSFEQLNSITVIGHTDYLGSDAYNQNLSQQRAETVRRYLAGEGLPAEKIRAVGMGESQPVKQCDNRGSRNELIACLQPNRRVEIQVDGYGTRR
ncbi:OmpA family protein [Eikenella sp. Marseille-P7795]